jgi:WD40 repeat protein
MQSHYFPDGFATLDPHRSLAQIASLNAWVTKPDDLMAHATSVLWNTMVSHVTSTVLSLAGHSGSVQSVAFSPDDSCIISGSHDDTVRLWDPQNGRQITVVKGHTDGVNSVAFSPHGEDFASGMERLSTRVPYFMVTLSL